MLWMYFSKIMGRRKAGQFLEFISAAYRMAETSTLKVPLAALNQGHAPVTLSQYQKDKNP